jgi:hypothetical protein
MAADEDLSGVVGLGVVEGFPAEDPGGLLVHGQVGVGAGVGEDVGGGLVVIAAGLFEEMPVIIGDVGDVALGVCGVA